MSESFTPAQSVVLSFFDQNEAGTTSEIASFAGKKPQAVATIVKSLVAKGVLHNVEGTYTRPEAGSEEIPGLDDAIAAATARQEKGTELVIAPSGKVAKMVRITLDVRVSTDGRWIVARRGDAWALLAVEEGKAQYRGEFPTCTAAFAPANLA